MGNQTLRSCFNPHLRTDSLWPAVPLKMINLIIPLGHRSWLMFDMFSFYSEGSVEPRCDFQNPWGWGRSRVGVNYGCFHKSQIFGPHLAIQKLFLKMIFRKNRKRKTVHTSLPPLNHWHKEWVDGLRQKMLIQFLWFHDHEGHDVNTEEKNILFDVN